MPHYHRPPRRNSDGGIGTLIILLIFIFGVGSVLSVLLPILIIGGIGWGLYKLVQYQKRLEAGKQTQRIADLQATIKRTDKEIKELDTYYEQADFHRYALTAKRILPQMTAIQVELDSLKSNVATEDYNRISQHILDTQNDISYRLSHLTEAEKESQLNEEERRIKILAPELWATYQQIKTDDATIREKIKSASNPAELTALHESNMKRFEGILTSYLAIKESPKNYYNADQRLEQAQTAIEQFDRDLDETLRQLNEDAMHDFEVNLRLMKEGKDHVEN